MLRGVAMLAIAGVMLMPESAEARRLGCAVCTEQYSECIEGTADDLCEEYCGNGQPRESDYCDPPGGEENTCPNSETQMHVHCSDPQ